MGTVKMSFNLKFLASEALDAKLLASMLLQLPNGTRFVGMEMGEYSISSLLFFHPSFKDGAELKGDFTSEVVVENKEVTTRVDHFTGLNLKEALKNDSEGL